MQRLAGRYLLDERIGAGGAAAVYRARDEVTGEWVAVKLAHRPVHHARFEREAAVLSVIASEHVVKVLAAGREAGVPYVVMELLEGQDLEQAMAKVRSVAARDVVGWLRQAARALDLAHGVGLVHRDLKPSNLFLETRGRLKVLDFGLVKQEGDERPAEDTLAGTPQYMAPEQVRGQAARIGPATDVWAVGMIAVHLLTGEPYWRGATVLDVLSQIDSEPMALPSKRWPWLPPAFDEWFARACQRNAAQRFASVGACVTALARAMAGVTGELVPSGAPGEGLPPSTLISQFIPRLTGRKLIGRIAEQRALAARLASGRPGLITVTGPGGIGKSALAEHVVGEVAERFPDGICRILVDDMAAAADLAAALAQIAGPRALVWVDAGAGSGARALVGGLMARAPGATWLVTSRVPLDLPGEERVLLAPLDVPAEGIGPDEASRYDALALFTARAAEAAPGFALRPADVGDAARVVRAAGGIPLAIELAASQIGRLPLSAVAARQATGAPLHRALEGTLELLGDDERRLLQALAVAGVGATAAELRRLSGGSPDEPLAALAERGLVHALAEEPVRWALLPPVRELVLRADTGDLRRRWVRLLAEAPDPHRLDDATDALAWALGAAPDEAVALAAALVDVWALRGSYAEGSRWLRRTLDRAPDEPGPARRQVLQGVGRLALLACGYDDAERFALEAATMARRLGDEPGLAAADQLLGSVARERGQYGRARARHEAARRRWARLGRSDEVARSLGYLAFAAWLAGDLAAAAEAAERVELDDGDDEGWAWNHLNRGAIAHYAGRAAEAEDELGAALDVSSSAGFAEGIGWSLDLRGCVALAAGDLLAADARFRASLRVHLRVGDRWRCASVLEGLAATMARAGDAPRAARLLGVAESSRVRLGMPVPACERARLIETLERAGRQRAGTASFEEEVAELIR